MSPAAENVIDRLDAARQKWWLISLLTTTVLALSVSFGTLIALMLADSFLQLSQSSLGILFFLWLSLTTAILLGVGRRLLRGQRSIEAAARRVETEYPELGSHLINVVQLSEDQTNGDPAFRDAAVRQSAARIGDVRFDQAPGKESRWRRFLYCMQTPRDLAESFAVLAFLLSAAVVCELLVPNWSSAASRLMTPWEFVPSVGSVKILSVAPGDTDVLVGQSVEVTADIENPSNLPLRAVLLAIADGESELQHAMTSDEKHRQFKLTLPSILKPTTYRLEIGDTQSRIYTIGVREKPVVDSAEVTFHYPSYLSRKSESHNQKTLDLEAPQYTKAELKLHISTPVAKGVLELQSESGGQRYIGRVEQDGYRLAAAIPLLSDGSYSVRLEDDAGHSDPNPRLNRIAIQPDRSPSVELLKPVRQSTSAPGEKIPVVIRAADDHGISRLQLEMKVQSKEEEKEPASTVKQWTDFSGESVATAVRHFTLELDPEKVKPGDAVMIRAIARDNRRIDDWGLDLQPQQSDSGWHTITIVAQESQASKALEQVENLRKTLSKIFEKQVHARVAAGSLPSSNRKGADGQVSKGKEATNPQLAQTTVKIRTEQIDIQKSSIDLVQSIGSSEVKEHRSIKRILGNLATGDMLHAISRCDILMKLASSEELSKNTPELIAVQDRIIAALRKLLDAVRHDQTETMAGLKKRPGDDLPDDVKHKLDEMRKKLDKFLEQQKKVIESTQNLAKTPVEDFTKEQEELLKGLAAAEDNWAKFMKDLNSDLSKLPEQDFANPSLAKESVEIQVELKWAEDSLLAKSVDIAVPLEQLGAEMAEEMKTNIEKWLPDSPDREKWSQEEPLTDEFKEAPMAELPGELEDMIGELADKEEDLFDEMEDVSSSWTDSLDKGAGWDTLDGPISNMSARGVTGNRLPNASEIGGRSGEGRQGKASGEFVGDEAVGKGGRKTPSRLTPDPYVKGQIKDHSKESPGGATGGGKESGKGGEGLEGPGPRNPGPRDAERLAAKQATLRNKAESVNLQFQVMKFHRMDLSEMIEVMAQVERDLKAGRYQNALRQRKVLAAGLGNAKQHLEGDFEVRRDTSTNLPADVQKEILGSMQDPSPAGWEELNRQYFERLSGGDKTTPEEKSGKDRAN
jgi:hypothetical protein